jgi:C4-dicarboxylate-specific signal transduction histidine kinase
MPHNPANPYKRLESARGGYHNSPIFLAAPTPRDLNGLAGQESKLAGVPEVAGTTNLGVLTASIAHELNQPLSAIIANSETSLRWLARPDLDVEKVRELARRVIADARRASKILDRIHAVTSGRPPRQTPVTLDDVIEETTVFLRHEIQSGHISLSLDLASKRSKVFGDHTQLQQAILNLLMNAVQAVARSGDQNILVRTQLSDRDSVCCTIEDSGPGINSALLPHLFDSFFTTRDTGAGMGLAISRSVIEAHGGQIQADNDSSLGGARFRFALRRLRMHGSRFDEDPW